MGRVALLSGVDGSQLDEIIFEEENLILYGVGRRGNLLAVSGYIGVSPNLDMFTALLAPSLIAPAEGAQWESRSKQTILWDKALISGKSKVNLYYSADPGTGNWIPLKENTGNSGKYVWAVPDITPLESVDTCAIAVSSVGSPFLEFVASPPFSIGFPQMSDFNGKRVYVGDTITITGNFFGTKKGQVIFGKAKGKVATWTPTSITVQVPKKVLSGPFTVVTATKNQAVSFPSDLVILPQISKISPASGSVGKKVTISGSGFGVAQGIVTFFDSIPATVLSWSDTKIAVEVPSGAATGRIRVTNAAADWAETAADFEVIP
jgi:hypothetical protein